MKSSQADSQAIGVFDSGIGGVTVLCALAKKFPQENFVYLGDTARLPYGTKSGATIRKYTEQNLKFLKTKGVKALVIACNSASAQWSETEFEGTPVFTVIAPAARAAVTASTDKKIGVLGTRATIKSKAYELALQKNDPLTQVFTQACPLLVPLAEEGWIDDPVTNLIAYRYLQPLLGKDIDTLILGCTHYPILRSSIQKAIGAHVTLIDCGQAVAEDLAQALKNDKIGSNFEQRIDFYCTDISDSFNSLAKSLLQREGLEFQNFEVADLQDLR